MIIFVNTVTSRFRYISKFITKLITTEPLEVITDQALFDKSVGPKINYSAARRSKGEFWIEPTSLLFETNVQPQAINVFNTNDYKAFFSSKGDFPFDIFAASFFLLSRYEEYLPHKKDMYGRYAHENSIAFREKFLDIPLINLWLKDFREAVRKKFPTLQAHSNSFNFLPTYDIDEAWAYKHKSWWRAAGAATKAFFRGDWKKIGMRKKVLSRAMKDPYESYGWMDRLHQIYKLKPQYFFLLANKTWKYDRNILPEEPALQKLIRDHAEKYPVGIHPSWQSGDHPSLIGDELRTLEEITSTRIVSSRQHYIRLSLPETYRYLLAEGIHNDFSMGYGSINGFRASIATPFYWYDLLAEKETTLLLYPFCFMDANSFFEQKLSPKQALEEMKLYYEKIKSVNGLFISIWHNTFLGTDPLYTGWKEAYWKFIEHMRN